MRGAMLRAMNVLPRSLSAVASQGALYAVCAMLSTGCGGTSHGEPEAIPDLPPAQPCAVIDPTKIKAEPTRGPDLKALRPHRGPGKGLPMTVPAMLTVRGLPTRAQWMALPPTADAALVEAMEDVGRAPIERTRAISGIVIRQQEGAGPRLSAVLTNDKIDPMVRRSAARGLASAYIATAEAALLTALADPDPMLRETVAKALKPHLERPGVQAAMSARQKVETAPLVKEALSDALTPAAP